MHATSTPEVSRLQRLVAAGLLAMVLLLAGCGGRGDAPAGALVVHGTLETDDARWAFKVPGRLVERLVGEGDRVEAGALVARLDATELGQELAVREAEVAVAAAVLAELEAGARPQEIAALESALRSAEAERERAVLDLARQEALRASDVVAEREFEAARAAARVAEARVGEVGERLALLRAGPRAESIDQARARLEQARAAAALARTRFDEARLIAPSTGVVLARHAEPGEFLAVGAPVVTVADTSRVWLRGYVGQLDLGRLRVGQEIAVAADAFPGRTFTGRVAFISPEAEFTPKTVQTEKERVTLVFRVRVDLANPAGELKAGMAARAILAPQSGG